MFALDARPGLELGRLQLLARPAGAPDTWPGLFQHQQHQLQQHQLQQHQLQQHQLQQHQLQQPPSSAHAPDPFYGQLRDQTRFWIQRVAVPLLMVVGLFGNSITVIIMTRRRMRSTTNMYLAALAFVDMFYLVLTFLLGLSHYPNMAGPEHYAYWKLRPYLMMLTDASSNTSVWLTVTFTIERFIAVKYPMKGKLWCTEARAKVLILVVFLFGILFALPVPFEWKVVERAGSLTRNVSGPGNGPFSDAKSAHQHDRAANDYVQQQQHQHHHQQQQQLQQLQQQGQAQPPTQPPGLQLALENSDFGLNETYKTVYYWSTALLFCFIPLLSLMLANGFLIKSVHESRRARDKMAGQSLSRAATIKSLSSAERHRSAPVRLGWGRAADGPQHKCSTSSNLSNLSNSSKTHNTHTNTYNTGDNSNNNNNNNNNNNTTNGSANNVVAGLDRPRPAPDLADVDSAPEQPAPADGSQSRSSGAANIGPRAGSASGSGADLTQEVGPGQAPAAGGQSRGRAHKSAPTAVGPVSLNRSSAQIAAPTSLVAPAAPATTADSAAGALAAAAEPVAADNIRLQAGGQRQPAADEAANNNGAGDKQAHCGRPAPGHEWPAGRGPAEASTSCAHFDGLIDARGRPVAKALSRAATLHHKQQPRLQRSTKSASRAPMSPTGLAPVTVVTAATAGPNPEAAQLSGQTPSSGQQHLSVHHGSSQERHITIMLIAVVILFLICQIPTAAMLIYTSINDIQPNTNEQALLLAFGNLFNFLMAVNAAGNFILYSFLSKKYRRTFVILFCQCVGANQRPQQNQKQQKQQHQQLLFQTQPLPARHSSGQPGSVRFQQQQAAAIVFRPPPEASVKTRPHGPQVALL